MGLLAQLQARWTRPEQVAVLTEQTIAYEELRVRVARARGWIRNQGLGAGDILALRRNKSPAMLELLLGALGEGVVVLPLNPRAPMPEIDTRLAIAAPARFVDHGERLRAALDGSPAIDAPDAIDDPAAPALLCFTSGTTGTPKGALLSHGALQADLEALHEAWHWTSEDRLLHALPLFHIHGLLVAQLGALWAGASTVWMPHFDPQLALDRLRHAGITVFMGVPTFHHRLLEATTAPEDLPLRLVTSGSAPLPAQTHRRFEERFGVAIVERYGMTEVGIVLSNPYDGVRKPGSVGLPLPGVQCRITDPETGEETDGIGEVRIAGPTLMTGYLHRPEATEAAIGDGWMHTSDIGWRDDDGYVHLLGRRHDLILVGGFNVYPLEVEAALVAHPKVREAAVVGLTDDDLGEVPAAALVGDADLADLEDWLRARLSAYKLPRTWRFVAALPRNATGKIDRQQVRSLLIEARGG